MSSVPNSDGQTEVRLKFRDYTPLIDVTFWFQLEHLKLHDWKLDEPTVPLYGAVASINRSGGRCKVPSTIYYNAQSLITAAQASQGRGGYRIAHSATVSGAVQNLNTPEQLEALDKKAALTKAGFALLLDPILNGVDWARFDGKSAFVKTTTAHAHVDPTRGVTDAAIETQDELCFLRDAAACTSRFAFASSMTTFANLKSHQFQYVLSFPALDFSAASPISAKVTPVTEFAAFSAGPAFERTIESEYFTTTTRCSSTLNTIISVALSVSSAAGQQSDDNLPFIAIVANKDDENVAGRSIRVIPFSPQNAITFCSKDSALAEGLTGFIVFNDTSEMPQYPGWSFRNLMAAIRIHHPECTSLRFLGLRDSLSAVSPGGQQSAASSSAVASSATVREHVLSSSRVYECSMAALPATLRAEAQSQLQSALSGNSHQQEGPIKVVGWSTKSIEVAEMASMMNPAALADSSSKLNLSLMKWRMMPSLDLSGITECKALLLGSGTLGCNIARHLLMWGVTHITMVDRGNVSYSNPVRQTLFEVQDVVDNKSKADAARDSLKRILPNANVSSVNMTIRMPGHRVHVEDPEDLQRAKDDIAQLERLIGEHDVTFLLTDSREARWLPTVIATALNKPVLNTALGFDTYVVMRHGLPGHGILTDEEKAKAIAEVEKYLPAGTDDTKRQEAVDRGLAQAKAAKRPGCYFCSDVVAPMDSLTARTLDQQCTVTRPGVSGIASALTVEVLASLYNHPKFFMSPAYKHDSDNNDGHHAHGQASTDSLGPAESVLGIIPHQIRGSVSDYTMSVMYGHYYDKCTACSDVIVDLYKKDGVDFIVKCMNEPLYMEEVTGLRAEKEAMEAKYANWEDDDAMFDDEFDESD